MFRRVIRPILTVSVLLATIAGFIYYFATHPAVRHQLAQTSPLTLATLFFLYLSVLVALSLVTLTTLRLCKISLPPSESLLLTMYATVVNFFGPLQSGPAFRGVYLKRKHNVDLKKYAAATLVFYALYAAFSGLFLLSGLFHWWLLIAAILAVAVLWYVRTTSISFFTRFQALDLNAIYALAAATLLQLAIVAVIYFVELRSIDHTISFGQAIIYAGAANFALFVSLTPGAIGFRESFLLFSRHLHHIDANTIVAANIIDRAMYIVLLTVIGVLIFGTHAQRRFQPKG